MKNLIEKPTLAIFANFFIDNEERLQRMKDSFNSFKDIKPKEWVINIRGSLKHKAGNFLKKELGEELNLFYLQSKQGWMYDSLIISKKINSDYVLYWIEDHILIAYPKDLENCIIEMKEYLVDQLWYSFFLNNTKQRFDLIASQKFGKYIKFIKLDSVNCLKIRKSVGEFYTVSGSSIMCNKFFIKILSSSKPYIKRCHRNLPFDFEKTSSDNFSSVIWTALPNRELFVPIDDDHGEPGSSLIYRGLYPSRICREDLKNLEYGYFVKIKKKIIKLIPINLRKLVLFPLRFLVKIFYTLNFLIHNR